MNITMSKGVTFNEGDLALCIAVLKQIKVGGVDYELLAKELRLPSKGAAAVRWCRFNAKLKKGLDLPSTPEKNTNAAPRTPPSTPSGKLRRQG